jgi:hypothetical protein
VVEAAAADAAADTCWANDRVAAVAGIAEAGALVIETAEAGFAESDFEPPPGSVESLRPCSPPSGSSYPATSWQRSSQRSCLLRLGALGSYVMAAGLRSLVVSDLQVQGRSVSLAEVDMLREAQN